MQRQQIVLLKNLVIIFLMFYGITSVTIASDVTVSLSPSTVSSPAIGEQLTFSLSITGGANVAGYQATVTFDTTALKYVQSDNGDYLPTGAFAIPPKVKGNTVTVAATSLSGTSNGDGTLATITFEIVNAKASTLTLSDVLLTDSAGGSSAPQVEATQITEPTTPPPPVSVTTVSFTPSSVSSPAVGEQLTVSLSITAGENVAGYQTTVTFDTTALKYVQSDNGNYLPTGAFFIPPKVEGNTVTLAATSLSGTSNGDGTLATITFEIVAAKASTLTLSDVLLTDIAGGSSAPQVEAAQITEPTPPPPVSVTTVSFTPSTVSSPNIGEQLTFSLSITGGENVAGYQAKVTFDTTALKYVQSDNGDYLPTGAFFIPPKVVGNKVTLAATSLSGASNGDGTLATITFEIVAAKASTLTLSDVLLTDSAGGSSAPQVEEATQITEPTPMTHGIGLTLPPDLISEVALGPNSTYFVLNAKYPKLTGVDDADVSYGNCTITLDLEGVPDNALSDRLLPALLEYIRQVRTGSAILNMAKDFAEQAGLLDVFPDAPQYFIFPLQTAEERSREVEAEAALEYYVTAFTKLVGLIPLAGDLISFGVTAGSTEYNRVLAINDILKSTMDPVIVLDAWGFLQSLVPQWQNPGRPNDEEKYVLIIPKRVTEIKIKVEQVYMLKSDQGNVHTVTPYEGTYNLETNVFSAPSKRLITLSDYPPFHLLSQEVKDFLRNYFSEPMNRSGWHIPIETALLANYPNPFNPETWIPYQLAVPANVSIAIYAADGKLVRKLELGHQAIGIYKSLNRAAYWDGKNALGEPVASGLYFYKLTAGEFTATRKMLIRK